MSDVTPDETSQSVEDEQLTTTPIPNSNTQRPEIKGAEESNHFMERYQSNVGGRLQFYLDGKVVLELSDRCDNGKTKWVPVSIRKTYWPPPNFIATVETRQDYSGSVSISDESTSVQSQPSSWQRETRWKNPCPVKKLTFNVQRMFVRIRGSSREHYCCFQWNMRRKPFLLASLEPCLFCFDSEGSLSQNCIMGQQCRKRKGRSCFRLARITSQLLEKAHRSWRPSGPVSYEIERKNEALVSPRKRISALRDLEKVVCLKNPTWNALKKAKAIVPPTPFHSHFSPISVSHSTAAVVGDAKAYDRQSSYSIDSLLNSQMQQKHEGIPSSSSSFLPINSFIRSSLLSSLLKQSPSYSDFVENKSPVTNFSVQLLSHSPTVDLLLGSSLAVRHPLGHPRSYPDPTGTLLPSPSLSTSLAPLTSGVVGRPASSSSSSQDDVFDMRKILPPYVTLEYEDEIAGDNPLNLTINKAKKIP